jgi:Protein of unknown function (DUF1153)
MSAARPKLASEDIVAEQLLALALALPPPNGRWWPRRKAAVVLAARRGIISREEACRRYTISPEEFAGWEAALDRYGIPGLRSTRLQIYRGSAGSVPRTAAAGPSLSEHPPFGREAE